MENKLGSKITTSDMVYIALMMAATCAVTMTIRIPTFIGYTHLGDSMVFLSAIILGKRKGTIASALGMFLADILGGYAVWAPFTLVIKGAMAYIAASIAYRDNYDGNNLKNNILAFVCAGTWMVGAYYIANVIITRFVYVQTANLSQSLTIALAEVPGNIIEVVVGIVIALPLIKGLNNYIHRK